jgi:hypothetical protein
MTHHLASRPLNPFAGTIEYPLASSAHGATSFRWMVRKYCPLHSITQAAQPPPINRFAKVLPSTGDGDPSRDERRPWLVIDLAGLRQEPGRNNLVCAGG